MSAISVVDICCCWRMQITWGIGKMRKCGMRNAESKVRNVRAEWCVECGMRKACNQGVLSGVVYRLVRLGFV